MANISGRGRTRTRSRTRTSTRARTRTRRAGARNTNQLVVRALQLAGANVKAISSNTLLVGYNRNNFLMNISTRGRNVGAGGFFARWSGHYKVVSNPTDALRCIGLPAVRSKRILAQLEGGAVTTRRRAMMAKGKGVTRRAVTRGGRRRGIVPTAFTPAAADSAAPAVH